MIKKPFVVLAALLAGCGPTPSAPPAPTVQIVYVTPAPTPTAAPTATPIPTPTPVTPTFQPLPTLPPFDIVYKEGDKAGFFSEDGDCETDVTVIRVVKWTSDNQFVDPDSGHRFITAEVKITGVTGTCEDTSKGYLAFTVGDPDGFTYDPEPAWRDPQLPYDSDMNLKPGRTYRGWVTFQYPKALTRGTLFFGDAEWRFTL